MSFNGADDNFLVKERYLSLIINNRVYTPSDSESIKCRLLPGVFKFLLIISYLVIINIGFVHQILNLMNESFWVGGTSRTNSRCDSVLISKPNGHHVVSTFCPLDKDGVWGHTNITPWKVYHAPQKFLKSSRSICCVGILPSSNWSMLFLNE